MYLAITNDAAGFSVLFYNHFVQRWASVRLDGGGNFGIFYDSGSKPFYCSFFSFLRNFCEFFSVCNFLNLSFQFELFWGVPPPSPLCPSLISWQVFAGHGPLLFVSPLFHDRKM